MPPALFPTRAWLNMQNVTGIEAIVMPRLFDDQPETFGPGSNQHLFPLNMDQFKILFVVLLDIIITPLEFRFDWSLRNILLEMNKLGKIILTKSVTSNTAEKIFSVLGRLKIFLRSIMSQNCLNNIAI